MWKKCLIAGQATWQYGVCTFHTGYLRLQIHTLRICSIYCFSTATMVARTRLNVTSYVHCLFRILEKVWRVLSGTLHCLFIVDRCIGSIVTCSLWNIALSIYCWQVYRKHCDVFSLEHCIVCLLLIGVSEALVTVPTTDNRQGKTTLKTFFSEALSTTNPTLKALWLNPFLLGGRLTTAWDMARPLWPSSPKSAEQYYVKTSWNII